MLLLLMQALDWCLVVRLEFRKLAAAQSVAEFKLNKFMAGENLHLAMVVLQYNLRMQGRLP